MTTLHFLIVITSGLLLNLGLTPLIIRVAHRRRWYDAKNARKIHVEDTPRLGGVGIFASLFVGVIVVILLASYALANATEGYTTVLAFRELLRRYAPFLLGIVIIHALGLVDDFRDLRAIHKLLIQIVAAIVVVVGPFRIERILLPFYWVNVELGLASYPVTVIWIVAVSNALNFIDGVDGLAGGTAALASLFFVLIGFLVGATIPAAIALALFGALMGFLAYNAPRAHIFMGDSGSYVLGFALSVFPLLLSGRMGTTTDLIPAITILGVPIVDMTTSVFRRLSRGKHPFSADREHMHHKLMDIGFGTWRILALVYTLNVVLGAAALTWYVMDRGISLTIIVSVWMLLIIGAILLTRASRQTDTER
jgi:UDP-GlcNAc:undecaprenyl-phosphate/decaprenyl-phosphate GlcNAc-1-phosphate transferase